jgi:DNA-binding NarL/FixJ family response regulator
MRILIVDDLAHVRESLRTVLALEPGWRVVGAAAGAAQALHLAQRLRPDVVLLDADLPECDVVRLARQLRGPTSGRGVVLLTTYDNPALRATAPAMGVDLCIAKGEGVLGLLDALRARYRDGASATASTWRVRRPAAGRPAAGDAPAPRHTAPIHVAAGGARWSA